MLSPRSREAERPREPTLVSPFRPDTASAIPYHTQMNEPQTYESVKRDIQKAIEAIRAKSPAAAEYLEKHLVMDDAKMTFAYTGDDRLKLERLL